MRDKEIVYQQGASVEDSAAFGAQLGISSLVAGILLHRGINSPTEGKEFLYGKQQPFGDPFLIMNMAQAVTRIQEALNKGEHITIYGDYDVDGITASSLLFLFLKDYGAKVNVYIPRRDNEGYGLNDNALAKLAAEGTKLLITVDTGISGVEAVQNSPAGMDIIITDHHMPPDNLPKAYTVVNVHQTGDQYGYKELAGAGVAFKLCQALYQKLEQTDTYWEKYIDLAALGTIADMVSLTEENREIVRRGLAGLAKTQNLGLKALIKEAGVEDRPLNSEIVGFVLAPRLNAAGRLDDAMDGVKLLTTQAANEAQAIAHKLNEENVERQIISKDIYDEAIELLGKQPMGSAIVVGKDNWHPGVIGIVASRLVERFNRPAILFSFDGEVAKGSCRSIPPVNMYDSLNACQEYLIQFGGHAQAAGLTLFKKNIVAFREAFQQEVSKRLQGKEYIPTVEPDYFVPAEQDVAASAVKELALLEPCGQGNPSPLLAFKDAEILSAGTMGKEHNHLWLSLRHGDVKYKGISWNAGDLAQDFYPHEKVAMAFAPKLNYFQGKENVDLLVNAVNCKHKIVDYRSNFLPKEDILKNILQKDSKTVVYLSNTSVLPTGCQQGMLRTVAERNIPEDVRQVVFYDDSCAAFWQDSEFLLNGRTDVSLYLLYRKEDFLDRRQELSKQYVDAQGMRSCYKLLHSYLAKGCHTVSDLLVLRTPEGIALTAQILQVFKELNFIQIENDLVSLKSQDFNPLTNSPTYSAMLEEYGEKLKELNQALDITPASIAGLWK